jgi:hypothetical protein
MSCNYETRSGYRTRKDRLGKLRSLTRMYPENNTFPWPSTLTETLTGFTTCAVITSVNTTFAGTTFIARVITSVHKNLKFIGEAARLYGTISQSTKKKTFQTTRTDYLTVEFLSELYRRRSDRTVIFADVTSGPVTITSVRQIGICSLENRTDLLSDQLNSSTLLFCVF